MSEIRLKLSRRELVRSIAGGAMGLGTSRGVLAAATAPASPEPGMKFGLKWPRWSPGLPPDAQPGQEAVLDEWYRVHHASFPGFTGYRLGGQRGSSVSARTPFGQSLLVTGTTLSILSIRHQEKVCHPQKDARTARVPAT